MSVCWVLLLLLELGPRFATFFHVHRRMLKGLICLNYWCIHFIYLRACRSVSVILNLACKPWSEELPGCFQISLIWQPPTWPLPAVSWRYIHPKIPQTKNHLKSKPSRRGFLGSSRVFRRGIFVPVWLSVGSVLAPWKPKCQLKPGSLSLWGWNLDLPRNFVCLTWRGFQLGFFAYKVWVL